MSSRRWQKSNQQTCHKKARYYNEASISIVADTLSMNYYRCCKCGCWHMTSRGT